MSFQRSLHWVLLGIIAVGGIQPAGSVAQTSVVEDGVIPIRLETLVEFDPQLDSAADNFELTPTRTANLNDGTGRILVSTLGGTIRVMQPNGSGGFDLLAAPLINSSQTGFQVQQESGMTAVTLHPNFAGNPNEFGFGCLYTITVENSVGNGGLSNDDVDFFFNSEVHQDVVREWNISAIVGQANVNSLPNLTVADSRELLRVDQPAFCHNIVDLGFDPSAQSGDENFGLLFITLGDGCADGTESQDLSRIYGSVLRIDPDPTAHSLVRVTSNSAAPNAGQPTYSIPDSNPFNGDQANESRSAATLAEIYAYGLRSPYRMGFDSLTGEMFIGDVGQDSREEVTQIQMGTNGGWDRFEGTRVNSSNPLEGPSPHTPPIFEYTTAIGRTVVGGVVYRGSAIPELQGKYVFADFGNFLPSGRLFYGSVDPSDPDFGVIFSLVLDTEGSIFPIDTNGDSVPDTDSLLPDRIFAIGEDEDGELLLVAGQDPRSFLPSVPGAFVVRVADSDMVIDTPNDGPIENPIVFNLDLDYNFNGIVHSGESSDPNAPGGFRSISDRALDFSAGIPPNAVLDNYQLIGDSADLDIVHLGNRNTVNGGGFQFDSVADGDAVGTQPDWLPSPDQSSRQTSLLSEPIELTDLADVSVVFQISNGGGSFDVVVGFTDGTEESFTATGPDWFGPFDGQPNIGSFPGTNSVDIGSSGEDLLLTESTFRIPNTTGRIADSISFENATNSNGGVAIVAANIIVEEAVCVAGDLNQDGIVDLFDVSPFVEALTSSSDQCEADVNLDGSVDLFDVSAFVELIVGG